MTPRGGINQSDVVDPLAQQLRGHSLPALASTDNQDIKGRLAIRSGTGRDPAWLGVFDEIKVTGNAFIQGSEPLGRPVNISQRIHIHRDSIIGHRFGDKQTAGLPTSCGKRFRLANPSISPSFSRPRGDDSEPSIGIKPCWCRLNLAG